MVALKVKDGNKKVRSLDIEGFVKPSGVIVASVTNDRGDTYFVQIRTDGTTKCEHMVNGKRVSCLGHFHTGRCYHVREVKAAMLPTFEEVNVVKVAKKAATRRNTAPVDLAVVRTFKQEDAYEQLAESKDPWAGLTEDEKVTAMGYYLMGIGA